MSKGRPAFESECERYLAKRARIEIDRDEIDRVGRNREYGMNSEGFSGRRSQVDELVD